MKKLCLLLGMMLFLSFTNPHQYASFQILTNGLIAPPNGVFLYDNLFIEDSEIMNVHYLEFLHYVAQDSSTQAVKKYYPDTTLFGIKHRNQFVKKFKGYYTNMNGVHKIDEIITHDEEVEKGQHYNHWYNYFSYVGTKNHPVVGVTYQQALKYCEWRSALVTNYFNNVLKKQRAYKAFKKKYVQFIFRLPTVAEWEFAAASGDKITNEYGFDTLYQKTHKIYDAEHLAKYLKNSKPIDTLKRDIALHSKEFILNFNCLDRVKPYFEDQEAEPEFIYFNKPNKLGLYNTIGNVAEMTSTDGIAKGGSFLDSLTNCAIKKDKKYQKSEKWLGFRPVCEVVITEIVK